MRRGTGGGVGGVGGARASAAARRGGVAAGSGGGVVTSGTLGVQPVVWPGTGERRSKIAGYYTAFEEVS